MAEVRCVACETNNVTCSLNLLCCRKNWWNEEVEPRRTEEAPKAVEKGDKKAVDDKKNALIKELVDLSKQ